MPSTITHAYFSMDLFDRFNTKKQRMLEPYFNQLKLFAQGPDVFFFYNLIYPKKGKHIRLLGQYMQQNKTQSFFINLITIIKKKKLEKRLMNLLEIIITNRAAKTLITKTTIWMKINKSAFADLFFSIML
jgi:hypothetical protein